MHYGGGTFWKCYFKKPKSHKTVTEPQEVAKVDVSSGDVVELKTGVILTVWGVGEMTGEVHFTNSTWCYPYEVKKIITKYIHPIKHKVKASKSRGESESVKRLRIPQN
jgi:hypothetical protein